MILFESDYNEGCHPDILERLQSSNMLQLSGYGDDIISNQAKSYLKRHLNDETVDIHFLVGGTQTNLLAISSILRPYQGVISADTGHIATHETGAIEATGHKVLTIPSNDGMIKASEIKMMMDAHLNDDSRIHTVQPGMVYLSFPTENGTIYTRQELMEIRAVCDEYQLPIFIDGARLGYGIMAKDNDVTLETINEVADMFYIGATKIGAMFGEALVVSNDALKKDLSYMIKQKGALLAKGRMLGVQFECLFKDNLYFEISKHAIDCAMKIKEAFINNGYNFLYESNTNQQFPILHQSEVDYLKTKFSFHTWQPISENIVCVRFCTSWITDMNNVETLVNEINNLKHL